MVLAVLILLWNSSIFFLADARKRPVENAVTASVICFNFTFYWGLLNFLTGFPVYVFFILQALKPINKKNWVLFVLISFLLFMSHALWFLAGVISSGILILIHREKLKTAFLKLSSLVPVMIIAAFWYPTLAETRKSHGADISAHWISSFFTRLSPQYITDVLLGGIKNHSEMIVACLVFTWIFMSVYTNRKKLFSETDKPLFTCALFLIGIMLFAPETYMNTLFFSKRWFPVGMILLILSLPAPFIKSKRPVLVTAICLLLFLTINTSRSWYLFQKYELTGLENALITLPSDKKVIGLDFVKSSEYIKNRPFLQMFAYSQALKGAQLNFSFTEHASGIVKYKKTPEKEWTPGLEWIPERVSHKDFKFFDYAVINGKKDMHTKILAFKYLEQMTTDGRWRLYKIDRDKIPKK